MTAGRVTRAAAAPVDALDVTVCTVPTDAPEADGTLSWDSTTMVLVEARSGTSTGTGWIYGAPACASVIRDQLAPVVVGRDALDVPGAGPVSDHGEAETPTTRRPARSHRTSPTCAIASTGCDAEPEPRAAQIDARAA